VREPAVNRKNAWLALASLVAFSAACQLPAEATVSGQKAPAVPVAAGGKSDQSAQEHLYRLNPHPSQGFDVTVKVQGAPGPLVLLGGSARFQATGCSYVVSSWAGVRAQPEKVVPVNFVRQDEQTFTGTVYSDHVLDADYYGNGVCHWDMAGVAVGFSATGNSSEASFSADMSLSQLQSMKPVTLYYLKRNYGRLGGEDAPIFGQPTLERVLPEHRNEVFTITLTAKNLP